MVFHGVTRVIGLSLAVAVITLAAVALTASAAGVRNEPGSGPSAQGSSPAPPGKTPAGPAGPAQVQKNQSAYCAGFSGHLAADLGKSSAELQQALNKAAAQTIDDAIKNGDMTQSQADAARKKLAAASICPAGVGDFGHADIPDLGATYSAAEAKALGINADELKADLHKGMSPHQIADSKGITETQFRAGFAAAMKSSLDALVQQGLLTQKQEDQQLAALQTGRFPLWDRPTPEPARPPAKPGTNAQP